MPANREPTVDDGEVVYRRLDAPSPSPPRGRSRIDPALIPLVVGFAILLLLVLLLGNLSVRRLEETSSRTFQLEQTHLARTKLLMDLRVALTRLDNEARDRMGANARREIRPPLDLRLDTERNRLADQLDVVDRAQL